MSPRLLVNENYPLPALHLLREAGVDVLAVVETCPGVADEEVLALACAESRWLVTYDRDYGELIYALRLASPPAVLYLRQEPYPPDRPARIVLDLLADPTRVEGFFLVVSERSIRRRPLPMRAPG
jgi:predicted nuclease of predicted toxin-antitoxin system